MPTEDNDVAISKLDKKVDDLAKELSSIRQDLKVLSSIKGIDERVGSLGDEIESIKKAIGPVSKISEIADSIKKIGTRVDEASSKDDVKSLTEKVGNVTKVTSGLASDIDELKKTSDTKSVVAIIDEVKDSIKGLTADVEELKKSSSTESVEKKIEDLSTSVVSLHTILKASVESDREEAILTKIDDLQQYVAGLSGIEDKVSDLHQSFDETREIVSIIVRQLDDIERKYNKALDEVSKALETVTEVIAASVTKPDDAKDPTKKPSKKTKPKEADVEIPPAEETVEPPSTVQRLMDQLLSMVSPQTEAVIMARALEDVRDKLTTLISGSTPVLFQFGKRARELKSYPPTATLNENDIARLNKELREWKKKLEEIAKSS